ncbi:MULTISPECIES: META and DUF4377 domain-containing protein [unclassified Cupriavidus]|uniref:META and DUF4377 domain-containing protein n=1 Tax=unclassified Cupriavidus TaxID=2640874 RepID=UPI00313B3251
MQKVQRLPMLAAIVPAAAMAAAALLGACTTTTTADSPAAGASLSQTQSDGPQRWELVRWQQADGVSRELPRGDSGQPVIFEFNSGIDAAQGTVSGNSGCNRFTGGYGKTATGIRFDKIAGTRMACPGERMAFETALLHAMQSPFTTVATQPSATPQGRQIIWKTADGDLLQFAEREGVGRRGAKIDAASGTEKIVYIDSQRVECTGVGRMQCYRWRESEDAAWQLWYGPIEGLDFEPGVAYKLRVREYRVPNPPADASSIRWQLLKVEERRRGG